MNAFRPVLQSVVLGTVVGILTLAGVVFLWGTSGANAQSGDTEEVPDRPTGLSASSQTHDAVTLIWDDPGDNSIQSYQILRRSRDGSTYGDGRGAVEFVVIVDDTGSSANSFTDTTVTPRWRYVYRVKARNAQGLSNVSSYANAETPRIPPPPSAPRNLTADGVAPNQVDLSWDDPQDSSITGYQILRRPRDGPEYGDGLGPSKFSVIENDTGSPATTYSDSTAAPGTRYDYALKARNANGLSQRSGTAHAEIRVPPASPTGLALVSASRDGVTLAWDDAGDGTIESYQVIRRHRDGSEYGDGLGSPDFVVVVDDTGSPVTSYKDTTVAARTRYIYGVKARNSHGLSEVSGYVNAETPPEAIQTSEQTSRPNVVLILADDLGWGDLRSNNPDSSMITPRIDGIRASGVNFTDGHSPSSVCSPTRYGLLTGRYPWRSWLTRGNLSVHDRPLIGPDRPTLGTLLQGQGYRTAVIGKWHLGMEFARLTDIEAVTESNRGIDFDAVILDGPLDHGFDEFFGTSSNLFWQPHVYIRDRRFAANPDREDQPDSGHYEYGDVLDRMTEEAVDFIEREGQTDAAFFLYLPLHTPHTPNVPNAQFDGLTGLGSYADVVAQLDWSVGQVLDALNRVDARENTLVIFTSDNGSFMGLIAVPNHVDHRPNSTWRDGKKSIYEGGHRVPLFIQWPKGIEAGSTVDATVSLTDLYATLADIVGEKNEPGVATDSVSLVPLLGDDTATRGIPIVHHSNGGMFAIRDGRWKLVFGDGSGGDHRDLYLPFSDAPFSQPEQLYDLEQNPTEWRNVIKARPEVVARMTALMEEIRSAEDGTLKDDSTLRTLRFAGVNIGTFSPDVLNYAATVDRSVETVRVTAIPTATDARVAITTPDGRRLYETYSYGRYPHGQANIEFSENRTTITVTVTSPNKSENTSYTVSIRRVGLPTVNGTPMVGETLTADTSGIADEDGLTNATYSYQWLAGDGASETDIAGATSVTYTLSDDDQGKTIKVQVSFTDDAGNEETLTSEATAAIEASSAPDTPDQPSGSALWVGMIDLQWNEVTGADSYDVQYFHVSSWIDLPAEVEDDDLDMDIAFYGAGAVVRGLRPTSNYTFRVRAVNSHGASEWSEYGWVPQTDRASAWLDVPEPTNVPATGAPTINGRLNAGELLTVDTSSISDENGLDRVKFYYQWVSSDGTTDTDIAGATGSSYILTEADGGKTLKARVWFTDRHGFRESLTGAATGVVSRTATGMLTINGTARVGETLTASASDIQDEDGLDNATFSYQWVSSDGTADMDIEGATGTSYTLSADHRCKTIKVRLSFIDDTGNREKLVSAPAAKYVPPPPTEVAVTAEPIVLESTTADYFVLYASHTLNGATVWDPVQVTLGEEGTTTLAENVAPLPVDRYRAEKYLVADPGDVDGDCIDDITELGTPATMNPVNPNGAIDIGHGTTAIPDQETFDALSSKEQSATRHLIKFVVVGIDTERPSVYFQNTRRYGSHAKFLNALGIDRQRVSYRGLLFYMPNLQSPDGNDVAYHYSTVVGKSFNIDISKRIYTLMAAHMPLAASNLGLFIRNEVLHKIQAELPQYQASRLKVVFTHDIRGQSPFLALNRGEGYGLLRSLEPDERPHSRDVVIYETLPNEMPRVAGIITTVRQTPLSHVNLRALQDNIPNAFIADALDDDSVSALIDNYVHYSVTETGYTIRSATQGEVAAHYAASRPVETQTPERDLSVTEITPLSQIGFDDWDSFGVKAANVAVLGTLGFPSGTVPDGFAVPFYFYDEFMKHNDLYDDIEKMLADPDFQTDYDTMASELKKLRKKIKKAETPDWIETALTTMHATYPEGQSLRYRSSTNNEDLPGFNGAGLYDSKTQHPEETEEDGISKSLKQVYASLWNFRAFVERDFLRIDHLATAMGVLVHPNYSDELVNGVAVSFDPAYFEEGSYYVNSQVGEDLVTNPEANSVPEEVLLRPDFTHRVVRLSNQAELGQLLMTNDQMAQLRRHLSTVHERFSELYGFQHGEQFAIEIEFKITSDNVLALKQARPWVFAPLIANFISLPSDHHGANFGFRIQFSEDIDISAWRFTNRALEVTGGEVISAGRVDYRDDLWEISIAPDSDQNVTIVLNHDVPCTVPGAICTADGRRLAVRLEHSVSSDADTPATGAPTINGTLQVGETLTADTSGIADEDGLEHAVFGYQWTRNDGTDDADIFNATSASYLVVAPDDGGKTIKVLVSFTDDAGNEESLTSASTAAVNATVPGPPRSVDVRISGSGQLTVSWEAPAFDGGSDITGYTIQWREAAGSWDSSADVSSAATTVNSYTISSLSPGTEYTVRAVATNVVGDGPASAEESVTPNSPPTGQPVIRGTAAVGEILSVDTSGIADGEGLSNPAFNYQWLADDAEISEATGATHTLTSGNRGKTLKVRVSFTDDAGNQESLTSPPFDLSAPYGLSATAGGDTVVLNWESPMNFPYLFDYQILRGRPELGETEPLVYFDTGSAETTYTDTDVEPGVLYVYRVKAASFFARFSRASEPVEIRTQVWTNSPATGAPTISGSAQVGETLTADTSGIADEDGLTNATYSYQWLAGDGASDTDIAGATSSTYTLSDDEEGKTIKVQVSFTDDAGNEDTVTSQATAVVGAAAEEVVWEGELTVGRVPNVFPHALGYPASEDHGGSLSPDHFEIDGTVYTVEFLLHFAEGLWLGIDQELPVDFTLSVGGSVYEGSESKVPVTGSGSGGYWWPSPIPEWSLDESVQVSLTIQPREPMASRENAPLTAYLRDIPSAHDGQGTFTFELRFGEEPEPHFSYKTLRDHAFTVTGGSVVNARRLNKPSNVRWEITVRPDGNGEVTIILPATADCEAVGAICTGDGRMLFNRIELTVAGPGG